VIGIIRLTIGLIFFAISVILSLIPFFEPAQISGVITLLLLLSATVGTIPIKKIGGFIYDLLLYFFIWVLPMLVTNPVLQSIQEKFLATIAETMPLIIVFLIIDLMLDALRGFTPEDSIFNNLTFDVITYFLKIGLLYVAGQPLFTGL
jgi:hypothetical protein